MTQQFQQVAGAGGATPKLTFAIDTKSGQIPLATFREEVSFNFVLLEGIKMENGVLVKYYGDDSFVGTITEHSLHTPMYAEIRRSAEFTANAALELNDLWTRTLVSNKIFSVKTTALIRAPVAGQEYRFSVSPSPAEVQAMAPAARPKGLHDSNSQIDIYIDGILVCPNGAEFGAITLEGGDARWYHLEVQHRVYSNTVTTSAEVPTFSIKWESAGAGLAKQVIDFQNAIAEDVFDSESWSSATKLRHVAYPF